MKGTSPNPGQLNFLCPNLLDQLDPKAPLLQLAERLPWAYFEEAFAPLYSQKGRPAKPIRLMVGLCILKHLENLSDEALVIRWVQNPYYQVFCGETTFQWRLPCDPTDLVYFRKRIGEEGFEKILSASIAIHGDTIEETEVCIDTTVQEKAITFPTDDKLHKKVIERCWKLAEEHAIELRRSYRREMKRIVLALRFRNQPNHYRRALKASKRLKTIAGALVRELRRKLPDGVLQAESERFGLYEHVLRQKKTDKRKVYSLHEPHVYCMGKGKVHKKYEFGVKTSIAKTKDSHLIVGALAFEKNTYDGHTLAPVLEQIKRVAGWIPEMSLCDRGYRGKKQIGATQICIPQAGASKDTAYQKRQHRKRFRARAGIEGVIGHLKSDHRLSRNFLKGFLGDEINVLMAAAAFNFRKWLRLYYFCLYLGKRIVINLFLGLTTLRYGAIFAECGYAHRLYDV